MRKWLTIGALVLLSSALSACGAMSGGGEGEINSTPIKQTGESSYEFEPDDIEQAEEAPSAVREYCEGAVSEAQEVGCLSHVEESEVP
jgi:predicted small secreted protein